MVMIITDTEDMETKIEKDGVSARGYYPDKTYIEIRSLSGWHDSYELWICADTDRMTQNYARTGMNREQIEKLRDYLNEILND